jgi:hypothetical protein
MVKTVHVIASRATNFAAIVWQNRHHEALMTQGNNFKLTEKTILSRSKHYSDTVYQV